MSTPQAIPSFCSRRAAIAAALVRNGWSRTKAAAELGYTMSGFYWACGRYGVELPPETARQGGRTFEHEDVPLILALRAEGVSRAEVAEKFDLTVPVVGYIERKHGVMGDG